MQAKARVTTLKMALARKLGRRERRRRRRRWSPRFLLLEYVSTMGKMLRSWKALMRDKTEKMREKTGTDGRQISL